MVFEHESMQTPPINVRVSTLPCSGGEKAVLRLLPPQDTAVGLEQLGMDSTMLNTFQEICSAPHGIVLVTGPTGSGKSTTLYSVLTSLRSDKLSRRCRSRGDVEGLVAPTGRSAILVYMSLWVSPEQGLLRRA